MKNRIIAYILLGVLGILPLASCSDYLDKQPDDQLDLESVFENKKTNIVIILNAINFNMLFFICATIRI